MVKFQTQSCNTFWDSNYYALWILYTSESVIGIFPRSRYKGFMLWWSFRFVAIILSEIWNYYPVTDGKWCIWAHRAICTGGLNKGLLKCPARCNLFAGHFAQFPFVLREFTPSPDIWDRRISHTVVLEWRRRTDSGRREGVDINQSPNINVSRWVLWLIIIMIVSMLAEVRDNTKYSVFYDLAWPKWSLGSKDPAATI